MNKIYSRLATVILSLALLSACNLSEIDNYDGPNAEIHGSIYDVETGELVEQDIIRGMQIEYIEHGFSNPETQYQVVKNDGTFQNKMMFAGTYTMKPTRGNFVVPDPFDVQVKGKTEVNIKVQPYIRIKDGKIEKENDKIIATFRLEQTIDSDVRNVAFFAHKEANVGDPLEKVIAVKQEINAVTSPITVYRIEIDPSQYSEMKVGTEYYFRIGALMNATEAKYNYLPAVRIKI